MLFVYWLREYFVPVLNASSYFEGIEVNLAIERVQFMLPATVPGWVRFSVKVTPPSLPFCPREGGYMGIQP